MPATAKRPDRLKVIGKDYRVLYRKSDPALLEAGAVGLCEYDRLTLRIQTGQHPVELRDTVLHELLHAICYQGNAGLHPEEEERAVRIIATGLLGTLREQPEFARWLVAPVPT